MINRIIQFIQRHAYNMLPVLMLVFLLMFICLGGIEYTVSGMKAIHEEETKAKLAQTETIEGNTSVDGEAIDGEAIDSEEQEETQDEEVRIFTDFEETEESKIVYLIDNEDVKSIASASSGSDITYYIVTNKNDKYKLTNPSTNIVSYIKMSGLEVAKIQVDNTGKKEESSGTKPWTLKEPLLIIGVTVAVIFAIQYYVKRTRYSSVVQVINSKPSSNNTNTEETEKIKTEDGVEMPKVRFSDVEGVDELKEDVFRIIDCIKAPEKYKKIGARPPKGVILYGPPGTGKTLLAKAIAGEAGVPFLSACASDFVEMYVGVGAKRVRDLYKKAKNKAPCIVFIDEIDAVASQRGKDDNSERDQTINALLAELDGFGGSSNVVTICATNRLDILDSAFTRAGRFDLKLAVGLPDKVSRLKILKVHSKNKMLSDDVDLEVLAAKTSGFSGAELEALLNEAAMIAAGSNRNAISNNDIEDAFFKIVMKGNKKRRDEIDETHRIIAWHEAGHTLATKILTDDEVSSVTIIGSSSGAGGVTFHNPKEGLHSKEYLKNTVAILYAGRAAEEIFLGSDDKITTGASQDIKQATNVIKQYLGLYGMGRMGMLDITQLNTDFDTIVQEASELSLEIYKMTLEVLRDNKDILEKIANTLLEKETLNEAEIDSIIKKAKGKRRLQYEHKYSRSTPDTEPRKVR